MKRLYSIRNYKLQNSNTVKIRCQTQIKGISKRDLRNKKQTGESAFEKG